MSELEQFRNQEWDGIMFVPDEDENKTHVEIFQYKDFGEKVKGSAMGNMYQIILFRETYDGEGYTIPELFDAILVDPITYATRMLKSDWYAVIGLKTSESHKFFNDTMEKLKSVIQ